MDDNFDTIIIGAGQAGIPLARALAESGKTVALVERAFVGGTCINYGCTPTKTMIASSDAAYMTSRSPNLGVTIDGFHVEMQRVRERKRAMVKSWREGSESSLTGVDNLSLLYGDASFTAPNTINISLTDNSNRTLSASTIVINTGGKPVVPNLPGLANVPFLDSTSIMELDTVPSHLVVLGGGYIACEFAQMFRRFGSKVTIVQRGGQLLGREDDDVSSAVLEFFADDGIDVLLNSEATSVSQVEGVIKVKVSEGGSEQTLEGSHLLVAVGRSSNTETLNLTAVGIETDTHGNIKVNDRLETSQPGVFCAGDAKGGPSFTHISYDDYRILKRRLIEGDKNASIAERMVPYTVFIDPQLGRVGLSESEARQRGGTVQIAKMPMSRVARAVECGQSRGFMKALVDTQTGAIIGCAVLGMQGGEIMAMMQIAMMGSVPYTALRDGVFSHPTLAEALNNLFSNLSDFS